MEKNIILIGLGPHAKRIYMKYLISHGLIPKLIVDLKSQQTEVETFLKNNHFNIECYYAEDSSKDSSTLPEDERIFLKEYIIKHKINYAIISTEPKAHFAYAMFFLDMGVNILMDKPITAPVNVISSCTQTEKIGEEYNKLCEKYKFAKLKNKKLVFCIQCQRRFQKGYNYVKNILERVVKKYNVPISYIDIYHNDGMWNMPNEFLERENHPYKYGYGKLFHSGYHFIDLLTWFLDINKLVTDKNINRCSIYSESYKPLDFLYNFNAKNYEKILHTQKFNTIIEDKEKFKNYGEIDVHSIINFYNDNTLITNCSLNLMQSGVSRRSWIDLPKDTYKGNGRIRHERVNIMVGPLLNIQVHSYQAYEIKDIGSHGGTDVGDVEHFDIYIFRNSDLIGGKPFECIKINDIDEPGSDFIGYNEKARERCLVDFLNNKHNDSDILCHKNSILITEKIYKSLVCEGKKMEFDFNIENNLDIKQIAVITDQDFGIEKRSHNVPALTRMGARGIVINEKNEIAILNKTLKNEYKLVGGGVEEGEDPASAFSRECMEEAGVELSNIKLIGTVLEDKSQENFKQLSFVFIAEKHGKSRALNLTKAEREEGARVLWMRPLDALKKMQGCLKELRASKYDSVYRSQFMVRRDIEILKYYLNELKRF